MTFILNNNNRVTQVVRQGIPDRRTRRQTATGQLGFTLKIAVKIVRVSKCEYKVTHLVAKTESTSPVCEHQTPLEITEATVNMDTPPPQHAYTSFN